MTYRESLIHDHRWMAKHHVEAMKHPNCKSFTWHQERIRYHKHAIKLIYATVKP